MVGRVARMWRLVQVIKAGEECVREKQGLSCSAEVSRSRVQGAAKKSRLQPPPQT